MSLLPGLVLGVVCVLGVLVAYWLGTDDDDDCQCRDCGWRG